MTVGQERSRPPARRWVLPVGVAVLCTPLVVAVVAFRRPLWTPVLDLAMTELRVRDVGGAHTPLIGLPGRIGTLEEQGSHPGPASFFVLAPVYRLLGATAWAMQVGTVVVHTAAVGTALWLAARRGGIALLALVAAGIAVLLAGYGGGALAEPWNPYLPLMWWLVALLAAWSVLEGDLLALPILVAAGSFCAQTHVPYLALCLGMGGVVAVGLVLQLRGRPGERRRTLAWAAGALGVGLVLWLPPTLDEVRHDPGNYTMLMEHFSDPPEEPVGLRTGLRVALEHLDVVHLVRAAVQEPGWLVNDAGGNEPSAWRGVVLLVLWIGATALAALRRDRSTLRLHLVVAASLALMVVSVSRIFGTVWYYLSLWGWSIAVLALVAATWTVLRTAAGRAGRAPSTMPRAALVAALLAFLVTVRFAVAAPDSQHADAPYAEQLGLVVDDVARGLGDGRGAATGTDGTYLVTWTDPFHIGSQAFGLLSELERRGFDAGLAPFWHVPATAHRTVDPTTATARVHLATGATIEQVRSQPGAVEIAYEDPRSPADVEEQARLREDVRAALAAGGLDDLVPMLDDSLFGATLDARVDDRLKASMERMLEIGAPLAVFVLPNVDPATGAEG